MATAKQIKNLIASVKKRVDRLNKELKEAKAKVNRLTSDYKKVLESEKKAKASKAKAKSRPKAKSKAKKRPSRRR